MNTLETALPYAESPICTVYWPSHPYIAIPLMPRCARSTVLEQVELTLNLWPRCYVIDLYRCDLEWNLYMAEFWADVKV